MPKLPHRPQFSRLPKIPRWHLLGRAVAVGAGSALIGAGFLACVHVLQRALWPTHWDTRAHLFVMIGAGASVALLIKLLGSPGDVELLVNNIHVDGGRKDIRDLRALIPVSLLCIAAGGALGPEAPLVQTTGSFGSWTASKWGLSRNDTRILTITGMAAGFSVLFGAPLGSAIFALEILHRRGLEYYEALVPAVVGSAIGYCVYAIATGVGLSPVWRFPASASLRRGDLLWAVGAGLAAAAISVTFTYLCTGLRWAARQLPPAALPVLGGALLGSLALWSPYALTFGETQIDPLVSHRAVATALVVAALAKLGGTAVTLASGWRGGFIIPLFLVGVAVGRLAHLAFPGTNEVVLMAAFMAATNTGVTKTPLGSTLVVTEMAGLQLLPTTLIAAVVALLVTSEVGLIHTQSEREPAGEPARGAHDT